MSNEFSLGHKVGQNYLSTQWAKPLNLWAKVIYNGIMLRFCQFLRLCVIISCWLVELNYQPESPTRLGLSRWRYTQK